MGASQRKEAAAYYSEWAAGSAAGSEEEFLRHAALYSQGMMSGCELYGFAEPLVDTLVAHNAASDASGKVCWLLRLCWQQLDQVHCNLTAANDTQLGQLCLVELTMRHLLRIVKGNSQLLLTFVEGVDPSSPDSLINEGERLCALLMSIIIKLQVDSSTVLTHVAVVRLLLTLTSTALYHSTQFIETEIDVFTEVIMSSGSLTPFVETLLRRITVWGNEPTPAAPTFYAEGHLPSLFNFYNMFSSKVPVDNVDAVGRAKGLFVYPSCACYDMLGRLCTNVVCVLVAHQRGNGKNPALDVVRRLQDSEHLQRSQLLKAIAARLLVCPTLCMLLYTLFYDNRDFLPHILAHDKLVLVNVTQQLLELHYRVCAEIETGGRSAQKAAAPTVDATATAAPKDPLEEESLRLMVQESLQFSYAFINFVTSTLLLILSQNLEVCTVLCDTDVVPQLKTERPLGKMTAGALALHVFCFSISRALSDHNEALTSVLAPCMSNIAASIHDMDAKTSQRMLSLLTLLLKKILRVDKVLQPVVSAPAAEDGRAEVASVSITVGDAGDVEVQRALGDMYVRQLQMLVEAIEGMLRGDNRHNESLIYELIYNRTIVIDAFESKALGPVATEAASILSSLAVIIRNNEAIIAKAAQGAQAPEIIMTLLRKQKNPETEEMQEVGNKSSLSSTAYTYEESAHSYDFFGPFVWGTQLPNAQRPGATLWCRTPTELSIFPK